jgi:hypothetical protein
MEKNKPEHTIRVGAGVKATIWRNETAKSTYYTVTISRTFERNGQFQDTSSFDRDRLLFVAKAAHLAYDYLLKKSDD